MTPSTTAWPPGDDPIQGRKRGRNGPKSGPNGPKLDPKWGKTGSKWGQIGEDSSGIWLGGRGPIGGISRPLTKRRLRASGINDIILLRKADLRISRRPNFGRTGSARPGRRMSGRPGKNGFVLECGKASWVRFSGEGRRHPGRRSERAGRDWLCFVGASRCGLGSFFLRRFPAVGFVLSRPEIDRSPFKPKGSVKLALFRNPGEGRAWRLAAVGSFRGRGPLPRGVRFPKSHA
jgi:hypothetical protein